MYRFKKGQLQVFLVHPGGPFWAGKDPGAWSVPKGLLNEDEDPLTAAMREFEEETGFRMSGDFIELRPVKQKGGKIIKVWAIEGSCDATRISSNTFSMEWPPGSGRRQEFPEIDRAAWFVIKEAKERINQGQVRLIEELQDIISKEK